MGSGERMAGSERHSDARHATTSVSGQASVSGQTGRAAKSLAGASTGEVEIDRASHERISSARPGTVTLFTDRAHVERRLRAELERAGVPRSSVAMTAAHPDGLPDAIEPRTVVILDAGASGYDADELLAHLGLVRALAAVPVVLEGENQLAEVDELVDDLCGGLVARTDADYGRIASAIARKAAALAHPRFEYLTVSPRSAGKRATSAGTVSASSAGTTPAPDAAPLLAIFADGTCALATRPVAIEDDGSDVLAIDIAEDAESARVELGSGRAISLLAAELFQRALPAGESRPLSAAEILAQIDGPTLGARIRSLRLNAGLTQAELARRTGIHRPNIARVEAGRHTPSLETIARLAAAIGVHATRVLQG